MPTTKRMKLENLKVRSFVTLLEDETSKVKGGTGLTTGINTCPAQCPPPVLSGKCSFLICD